MKTPILHLIAFSLLVLLIPTVSFAQVSVDRESIQAVKSGDTYQVQIPLINSGNGRTVADLGVSLLDKDYKPLAKVKKKIFLLNGRQTEEVALPVSANTPPLEDCLIRLDLDDQIWIKRFQTTKADQELHVIGQNQWISGSRASLRVIVSQSAGGTPIKDAKVRITARPQNSDPMQLAETVTDEHGSASFDFPVPETLLGSSAIEVAAESSFGTDKVSTDLQIVPGTKILVTADKPVYQPNQLMHIRALASHSATGKPLAQKDVTLEVYDGKGNKVFKKETKSSDFGIVSADFQLADEVNQGEYRIKALLGEDATEKTVQVYEYVLPKFRVSLENEKKFYAPGEKVKGQLESRYFFGKPADNARVTIVANCFDVGFNEFAKVEGKTNAEGKYEYEFTIPDRLVGQPLFKGSTIVQMDVRVRDTADHEEQKMHTFHVASEPLQIEAIPESGNLIEGVDNDIYLVASHPDGSLAQPSLKIESLALKSTQEVKTDDNGIAVVSIRPATTDANPNAVLLKITASIDGKTVTLNKEIPLGQADAKILLRPDKGIYKVGDKMKVDVLSGLQGNDPVFLDVIRNNQTVATYTMYLKNNKAEWSLPLDNELAGTLTLNTYIIRRDGNMVRDTRQVVVLRNDDLKIQILPDQDEYAPGAPATLKIAVTGPNGDPVQAALGMHIVDESVYSLSEKEPGLAKVFFAIEKELLEPKFEIHGEKLDNIVILSTKNYSENANLSRALLAKLDKHTDYAVNLDSSVEKNNQAQAELTQLAQTITQVNFTQDLSLRPIEEVFLTYNVNAGGARLTDPWGTPYYLEKIGQTASPRIYSLGRDKAKNTADDIEAPTLYNFGRRGRFMRGAQVMEEQPIMLGMEVAQLQEEAQGRGDVARRRLNFRALSKGVPGAVDANGFGGFENGRMGGMGMGMGGGGFGIAGMAGAEPQMEAREKFFFEGEAVADQPFVDFVQAAPSAPMPDVRLGEELKSVGYLGSDKDVKMKVVASAKPDEHNLYTFDTAAIDQLNDDYSKLQAIEQKLDWDSDGLVENAPAEPLAPIDTKQLRQAAEEALSTPELFSDDELKKIHSQIALIQRIEDKQEAAKDKALRVRRYFPETLFYNPELITDEQGHASVPIAMADSITTWRINALANAKSGAIGDTTAAMKVFKPFFVDLDLPVALIQKDEVTIPVAVYNYLPQAQEVEVSLEKSPWFDLLEGDLTRKVKIAAQEVTSVTYRIRAKELGKQPITVYAWGSQDNDAIGREIEVRPNGEAHFSNHNGRLSGIVEETVDFPAGRIEGADKLLVKIYPGVFSQIVEGLDSMLQMPYGCFEQTSSTTYPNILALDYMRASKRITPEVEMKAQEYINLGYQRLLTFEIPGGGFQVFGTPPATRILSAYGLLEFSDMSRVYSVDQNVIDRTKAWLLGQRNGDGTWEPDVDYAHAEMWKSIQDNKVLVTAYIALALAQSGITSEMEPTKAYLIEHADEAKDAYTLAILCNALLAIDAKHATTKASVDRLVEMGKIEGENMYWTAEASMSFARGNHANVEATAWAALALIEDARYNNELGKALNWIIEQKDPSGNWGTTHGTVLALKALVKSLGSRTEKSNATVAISINGKEAQKLQITPENSDVFHQIDITAHKGEGNNKVRLQLEGEGQLLYQIVGKYFVPWRDGGIIPLKQGEKNTGGMVGGGGFQIDVKYDRTELQRNDTVTCNLTAKNNRPSQVEMVMIDLGIPPGFRVEQPALDEYVKKGTIAKYTLMSRQLLIYIKSMKSQEELKMDVPMKATLPIVAKAPESTIYEYYNPEQKNTSIPQELEVK